MGDAAQPDEVRDAADATLRLLTGVLGMSQTAGSRTQWAAAVEALQRVVDVATAAQDAAIVRLAAIEPEWAEDGTELEVHRVLGHAALDAPAIVSGVLHVSTAHAERRVRSALRWAADGPAGTESCTGLGALHAAMAAGRLDAYRAGVVADELEETPPEVAAAVIAALEGHVECEDASRLRRRCRRVLASIDPELVRRRAERARSQCRLERWVAEPGVDTWHGTFPSEDAARAWAAIDALAQRYVCDGVCERVDGARAKALTDLVTGNATITTELTVTVPWGSEMPISGTAGSASRPGDLVAVTGIRAGDPVLVARSWLEETRRAPDGRARIVECDPGTGARIDPAGRASTASYRPGARLAALVRARDGRCRFPGCHVAARFCDLDHVRPWPKGPSAATNLLTVCRRHHRVKQRPGWRVVLAPDGTATWTGPTGTVRTTLPVDALEALVLADGHTSEPPVAAAVRRESQAPFSIAEFTVEHLVGTREPRTRGLADCSKRRLPPLPVAQPVIDHGARGRRHRPGHRWTPGGSAADDDPPPF